MKLATKLFAAVFTLGAMGVATFILPVAAAPITAPAGLQSASGANLQTVQGQGWNTGTQYGPDYQYYGPRSGARPSRTRNLGEGSPTGTQYGPDYQYYGPRTGARTSRTRNLGEGSTTGTQYGPDYQYYGPRLGSGSAPGFYQSAFSDTGAGRGQCRGFRSFDPASGTYVGRDGRRHACR